MSAARACTATFVRETCTCDYEWLDPLLIPLDGHPVRLTSVAGGVRFDVNGDGVLDRVAWTAAGTRAGFLVLDRNGNGAIDSLDELFGQAVSGSRRRPGGTANSFLDLAAFDLAENGGNGDGLISAADAVFTELRLWVDANHDGVSQPGEFITLAEASIASIELSAQPVRRRDRFGNYFKYRAVVHLANGRRTTAWDVFLAASLNGSAPAAAAALPWLGGSRPGPSAPGLAGLGVALIAVGLAGLVRPRRRAAVRLRPAGARVGVTGFTTVAAVLLWPAAGFGQAPQVVEYYDTDALGSVRAVSNAQGQLIARHDFLPFGEELAPQSPPADKKLFTGQERDFESGQDYFNARQLRTDLGRFLTVDPENASASLDDSQSWNAYAYGRNNPLRYTDPDGREYQICGVGAGCSDVKDRSWEGAMDNAGGSYRFYKGQIWTVVNGQWTYAGTYEQVSEDAPQANFDVMIHSAGGLAERWLREAATQMAIGTAIAATGGLAAGALSGGLTAGGATTLGVGGIPVVFKTMHYAPRLVAAGVSVAKAEAAVRGGIAMGQRGGELVVDGVKLIWRAYAYNGQLYVGTIHVKW